MRTRNTHSRPLPGAALPATGVLRSPHVPAPSSPSFHSGSRSVLTPRDLPRFAGDALFDKVARVVCEASCLPRKELYESWEVARRTRRRFRGGRVWDLAAGHGLLGHLLLVLDDSSPSAVCVDTQVSGSQQPLAAALVAHWPRLAGRVQRRQGDLVGIEAGPEDLVVSAHACGALSDRVIDVTLRARARLALLPCCHDKETCDAGALGGWMDVSLAVDATRVARLRAAGYDVFTQSIPEAITPKNRLLLAAPRGAKAPGA